jgi:hypothetical protein
VPTPLSARDVELAAIALTEARQPEPRPVARRPRRDRAEFQAVRRLALVGRVPARHHDR